MRRFTIRRGGLALTALAAINSFGDWGVGPVAAQQREMNVRQGPEVVFERPLNPILPELRGAEATGENGRVGNEFVFWGYELADDRRVFLFACAKLVDVDCDQRRRAICLADSTLIRRVEQTGKVRELECRSVSLVGPGDLRPGCTDKSNLSSLDVGLVQCS